MKASSWRPLAPWRRACTVGTKAATAVRDATPQPEDDGNLFPVALWNGCATSPIFNTVGAIMCNQGSPSWTRGFAVEEEDEGSRSAGEESSLWAPGKLAKVSIHPKKGCGRVP
jgi:hypothetical protein